VADEDQFRDFVTGRSQALLSTAYLLTRDWALAEDLLQTALVRSWLSWRRITGSPEQYVRRVLVNEYVSWWRRKWRQEVPTEVLPEPPGTGPDEGAAADTRLATWRLLGRLPRRQRAVIVLRYYEDLSEREIAAVLGCSTGTVKSQAAKALARLRADTAEPVAAGPAPTGPAAPGAPGPIGPKAMPATAPGPAGTRPGAAGPGAGTTERTRP
jgi:RNA polymerase sigma-70 factor (sigma-E family)